VFSFCFWTAGWPVTHGLLSRALYGRFQLVHRLFHALHFQSRNGVSVALVFFRDLDLSMQSLRDERFGEIYSYPTDSTRRPDLRLDWIIHLSHVDIYAPRPLHMVCTSNLG
jgi:hypothetical protein